MSTEETRSKPGAEVTECFPKGTTRHEQLFQQPIHLDFASGAEIDAPVHHDRDDETRGHGGAVALAVPFGGVDRLSQPGCVEGVEDGGCRVRAVPDLGCDGPDDSVLVAV